MRRSSMSTHSTELNKGVLTSWLPLTTAWPAHPACSTKAWVRFSQIIPSVAEWPYIYDPAYAETVDDSVTCLPPRATSWWQGANTHTNPVTSYSLGPIVCPEDYTTATTTVVSTGSTSVVCCPRFVLLLRLYLYQLTSNTANIPTFVISPVMGGSMAYAHRLSPLAKAWSMPDQQYQRKMVTPWEQQPSRTLRFQ